MEKFLQKIILILLFSNFSLFSQEISIMEKIRMPLWAELDAYPELKEAQDTSAGQFDYTISRIKTLSEFISKANQMYLGHLFLNRKHLF